LWVRGRSAADQIRSRVVAAGVLQVNRWSGQSHFCVVSVLRIAVKCFVKKVIHNSALDVPRKRNRT
jgi:hypothetical protein